MASGQVSPGVIVNEIDFSQYVAKISGTIVAMVGPAEWGPVNEPQYISSEIKLIKTFGIPPLNTYSPYDQAMHAAILYLREGNQLWFNRVESGATKAAVTITGGGSASLTFTARYKGTLGNRLRIRISNADDGDADHFKVEVLLDLTGSGQWQVVEKYTTVTNEADETSSTAGTGVPFGYLVATDINDLSDFIDVSVTGNGRLTNSADSFGSPLISGTNSGSGDDPQVSEAAVIGNAATNTGMEVFRDQSIYDINVLVTPGLTGDSIGADIAHKGIEIAEDRKDLVYLIDPDAGMSVQDVVDWTNGTGAFTNTVAFNSSYAAVYYPWARYFDGYRGASVYCAPSGWMCAVFARNDRVAGPQYAPMGLNRARLVGSSGIEITGNTNLGDRELLYGSNNVVNPIVNFPQYGIVVWGQRTTQRIDSALDRLNVRRMLIALEKSIATSVIFLVGEPADIITMKRFVNLVTPALTSMKKNRGIKNFQVVCDDTSNPPEVLEQNEIRGIIIIEPVKTAERIIVDFVITAQGADFNETLQALGVS